MQTKTLIALSLAMSLGTQVWASDDFDMGKVQILGKDAQVERIDPADTAFGMEIGDRTEPLPHLVPETGPAEFKPMTEKQLLDNFHRENKEEISVAAGMGTRGSSELIINGKGAKEGYVGDLIIRREARDGYKSSFETKKTGLNAVVTSAGQGSYIVTAAGEYSKSQQAERGTRALPTPNAGFEDSVSRLSLKGNSTLEDGSFFKGYAAIDSIDRDVNNHALAFSEEQGVFSLAAGASYHKELHKKFRGKAGVDIRSDKFTTTGNPDRELTKTVLDLGGDLEISPKSNLNFGLKAMSLMERDRTAPYARLEYRWEKPWQAVLSYDEGFSAGPLCY
jgi:hypothetical protein